MIEGGGGDSCGGNITYSLSSDELSSSSQLLIDAVKVESERRKSRLSRLRSQSEKQKSSPSKVGKSIMKKPKNSIMIIRSLEESLDSGNEERNNVIRAQRKRRLLKRRLSGFLKDLDDSHKSAPRRPQTAGSILSESSSSLSSSISTINFDIGFTTVTIREYPIIPGDNPR